MSDSEMSKSFWKQRGVLTAAVFIVGVIIAGIILVVTTSGKDAEKETQSARPNVAAPVVSSDSICGLEAGDQSVPTVEGPQTQWELVGRLAAPTATDTYGPGLIEDDGFRHCYAQSPVGALYAALNLYSLSSSGDKQLSARVSEELIAPGKGRDVLIREVETAKSADGDVSAQFAGFQFLKVSDREVIVDVALRASNGVIASFVTHMVWADGDWKMVVQDNGQPAVAMKTIPSLDGYIKWSGA